MQPRRDQLPTGYLWTLKYQTPDPRTGFRGRVGFETEKAALQRQAELAQRDVVTSLYPDTW